MSYRNFKKIFIAKIKTSLFGVIARQILEIKSLNDQIGRQKKVIKMLRSKVYGKRQ